MIAIDLHPMLVPVVLMAEFSDVVGKMPSPGWLTRMLNSGSDAPVCLPEELKSVVRVMLRHGCFKPTGRNKPSPEYLVQAAVEGRLFSVNLPADIGNVISLHSGLPVSVLDMDILQLPLRIAIAPEGSKYIFNPSGQELDTGDLLCLHDAAGPCGSPVKDSQRTKTHAGTRRVLVVIWGVKGWEKHVEQVKTWCCDILDKVRAEYKVLR